MIVSGSHKASSGKSRAILYWKPTQVVRAGMNEKWEGSSETPMNQSELFFIENNSFQVVHLLLNSLSLSCLYSNVLCIRNHALVCFVPPIETIMLFLIEWIHTKNQSYL
jgi:hypothetical protein